MSSYFTIETLNKNNAVMIYIVNALTSDQAKRFLEHMEDVSHIEEVRPATKSDLDLFKDQNLTPITIQ